MSPVRWGFLGAGFVARQALAPAVDHVDGAELVAVAARSGDRARALAPGARISTDYAAVIAAPDVDAVYISLTNEAHLSWTMRALAAGKHVLCEKPLGLEAAQVREMSAAAADADRLLVEASWNRWHPRTGRALELLRSGDLGTPEHVDASFTFRGVPAENYRWDLSRGGGALYDVGCYAVGAALAALDWPALTHLTADARWSDGGVDASTAAQLSFDGAFATIRASIDDDDDQRFVVTTDRARLELTQPAFASWHEPSELTVTFTDGRTPLREAFAACDPYALMVDAMSRRIRGDQAAWLLPLSESLRVAETLDAIRDASRT